MAVIEATDESFDELKKDGVAIVDFYSTHCGPCRVLLPVLLGIENQLPFINLIKVNTDNCPKLADRFRISSLPTVYLSRDGEMTEYHGGRDEDSIKEKLGEILY